MHSDRVSAVARKSGMRYNTGQCLCPTQQLMPHTLRNHGAEIDGAASYAQALSRTGSVPE